MTQGKAQAKRDQVELIAHAENGRVQNPNSYGRDPNPPKDKRFTVATSQLATRAPKFPGRNR
jgi:hypothetical protein